MIIWKLKPGIDAKIKSGHPWAYGKEISDLSIGNQRIAQAAYGVELQDAKGQFIARGYGNPKSQIAFRALSFQREVYAPMQTEFILHRLQAAWLLRRSLGFTTSCRLCFGEADGLPGLVVDYYSVQQKGQCGQVFAVQIFTAGMSVALQNSEKLFEHLVAWAKDQGVSCFEWATTAVVLRNDLRSRRFEGLEVEEPRFIKSINGFDFQDIEILFAREPGHGPLLMSCDLYRGQKTGFFLDQTFNIALTLGTLQTVLGKKSPLRVLDLCCYVGHWSSQIAAFAAKHKFATEFTLVDVSARALEFAKRNVQRHLKKDTGGGEVDNHITVLERDVLTGLGDLLEHGFDLVIADPPAFAKAEKDLPQGRHAYMQLNSQALRLTANNGWLVSCSCSSVLTDEHFRLALGKAIIRDGRQIRTIARGGHASDHPMLMSFPEGQYLKMYLHQVGVCNP